MEFLPTALEEESYLLFVPTRPIHLTNPPYDLPHLCLTLTLVVWAASTFITLADKTYLGIANLDLRA